MTFAILGADWRGGVGRFRIRQVHDPASEIVNVSSLDAVVEVLGGRLCRGLYMYPDGQPMYIDCSTELPEQASARCGSCTARDPFTAVHRAHGPSGISDEGLRRYLSRPHFLYVAQFRDGSLKVGTAVDLRKEDRLAEQGAYRAHFVARMDDGYLIRRVEEFISQKLSLAESVTTGRKLRAVTRSVAASDDSIARASEAARTLVAQEFGPSCVLDESWSSASLPATSLFAEERVDPYPLEVSGGVHRLAFRGLQGGLGLVVADNGRYVIEMRKLYGKLLRVTDDDPLPVICQGSLF